MLIFEVLACSNNITCMSSLIRWRSSSDPALFFGIRPSWRVERRLYTSCSKLDYRSSNKHIVFTEAQSKNDSDKIFFTALLLQRVQGESQLLIKTTEDKTTTLQCWILAGLRPALTNCLSCAAHRWIFQPCALHATPLWLAISCKLPFFSSVRKAWHCCLKEKQSSIILISCIKYFVFLSVSRNVTDLWLGCRCTSGSGGRRPSRGSDSAAEEWQVVEAWLVHSALLPHLQDKNKCWTTECR